MKTAIASVGCAVLMVLLAWIVWIVGIVFEFEYPYAFTLMQVQSARSADGVPVSKIINAEGAGWSHVHWHTCSYCAYYCGDHKNLISVHLEAPDASTFYYFGYCRTTRTLVPMTDATAARFPSLMPARDQLEAVNKLSKTGGGTLGYGELKLPAKWFRAVTSTDTRKSAGTLNLLTK